MNLALLRLEGGGVVDKSGEGAGGGAGEGAGEGGNEGIGEGVWCRPPGAGTLKGASADRLAR